jgi:hypothetical protein
MHVLRVVPRRPCRLDVQRRRAALARLIGLLVCLLTATAATAQDEPPPSGADSRPQLLAQPFASPRQLLRLLDVGDSDFRSFRDGQPIQADDLEALTKILHRMPQIGWDEIARWQRAEAPWAALRADPESARGEFYVMRGRVRRLERQSLSPRLATLFDFTHYYRVEVALDDAQGTAVVFARTIPQAWRDRPELDERTRTSALFVKVGPQDGTTAALLFVAPRIGWLPDRVEPALGVGPDQVLLSQWGMDAGLWDDVVARQRLPIAAEERECFYAVLAAVGRADPAKLAQRAQRVSLPRLLQHPQDEQGKIVEVAGRLRRITRVVVDEPDIQQRFGIVAYYQLDIMMQVGEQPIEVRGQHGEQAGPVYRESFPVTCCAQQLPEAWQALVGVANVNRPVLMRGVFYKLWAYNNPLVDAYDARQRQLSPMVMVSVPEVWDVSTRSSLGPGLWIGLGVCGLLAAVWVALWAMSRSERRRAKRTQSPPLDLG